MSQTALADPTDTEESFRHSLSPIDGLPDDPLPIERINENGEERFVTRGYDGSLIEVAVSNCAEPPASCRGELRQLWQRISRRFYREQAEAAALGGA